MWRRIMVALLLAALACVAVGAYLWAQSTDAASVPKWTGDAGPPEAVVGTPMLSVRRAPDWLSAPVTEGRLAERLSGVAASAGAAAQTCLVAHRRSDSREPLSNGQPVVSRGGDAPLIPSSLMKIVTAAAILETAGPAAVYTTEVFVRSDALATVSDGVLAGDVYLVGRGDPVLSTPAYWQHFAEPTAHTDFTELVFEVADALRQRGITTVDGGIVADESRFPEEERHYAGWLPGFGEPVWEQSYVTDGEVGPLSALLLNDGYTSFASTDDAAGRRGSVAAAQPAVHAAGVFGSLLEALGFVVTSEAGKGVAPALAERLSLGEVESPPMAEIVTRMLRNSDNTTAEMLLKEIGRRSSGSARAQAVTGVHDVLQRLLGIPTDGLAISDGSGLSRHSRLSCEVIAELLLGAGPDSPLVRGMAVVGETGALRDCGAGPSAQGESTSGSSQGGGAGTARVWALSAAPDDVSALAGVAVAVNGDVLTFALISNRSDGAISDFGFCDPLQRGLIAAVAGHPYGPSAADAVLHPLRALASP